LAVIVSEMRPRHQLAESPVLAAMSSTGMPEPATVWLNCLHDDVADLEGDLVGGELAVGAHDLGHEAARSATLTV
jgi:hypothetical protein